MIYYNIPLESWQRTYFVLWDRCRPQGIARCNLTQLSVHSKTGCRHRCRLGLQIQASSANVSTIFAIVWPSVGAPVIYAYLCCADVSQLLTAIPGAPLLGSLELVVSRLLSAVSLLIFVHLLGWHWLRYVTYLWSEFVLINFYLLVNTIFTQCTSLRESAIAFKLCHYLWL